jgi:hypothetical protein
MRDMNGANQTPHYPEGISYRTPRPRGTLAGILLGSLLGYAITRDASGALISGVGGGVLADKLLELPHALRLKFAEKGLEVIQYYRLGRFGAKVLFKYKDLFATVENHAPREPEMSLEQIEDWLYGDLTEQRLDVFWTRIAQRSLQ